MKNKISLYDYLHNKDIDPDLIKIVEAFFTLREYSIGSNILNMGENTRVVCLILQGIVRGVYMDEEGEEITKCFSKEGEWCCFYNMLTDSPSEYWIEALEDCLVAEIRVEDLRMILDKYQQFRVLYNELVSTAFILNDEKGVSFQRLQAKDRYAHFVHKYSDIQERVKQEYIASYLGITPSSLSRIKRKS